MKGKFRILMVFMVLLGVTACENKSPRYVDNQELRRVLFKSCMKLLPEGPKETTYNDWDEVVAECDNVARYQARTCVDNCN